MPKRKLYKPDIPKMPSGTGEGKKELPKRKKDKTGTVSRTRYISDKKTP